MNNNIALADIRAFVAIAQSGSFTKAAEKLSVSRAHLSRQLNQLEHQLDVQLLIRTTRSQRLTEAGEEFFNKCELALSGIDQAVNDIKNESEELQGVLSINCVGGPIGERILSDLVADFVRLYPKVEIDLDFSSQRVDLVEGGFDLVVRMGALEDSRFIARKLMDLEISVLASPRYLKENGKLSVPEDLQDHNCLTGSVKKWRFGKGEDIKEVQVGGSLTCKNGTALINAAKKHVGIVRVPRFYCHEEIANGELVPVLEQWQVLPTPIYALYHAKRHQTKRLKSFIQYLCDEFAGRFPL